MIVWRQCDSRYPFLWETASQPAARWHGPGEGPVQYFADSPDGAWCELIRHEEITDPADLAGIRRAMWAVEIGDTDELHGSALAPTVLGGGLDSYDACRHEARTLRQEGARGMVVPSAAIEEGRAGGLRVDDGLVPGPTDDGHTIVLFGPRSDLIGWKAADDGRPPAWCLSSTRHLAP